MGLSQLLGRRPRLWWGTAPSRLLMRGIAQSVIAGGAGYVGRRASTGTLDLAGAGLADKEATFEKLGTLVLVVAAVWLAYCALRIVVGVYDLVSRRSTEGVVIAVRERVRGDVLPEIVQDFIWSRGDRIDTRQSSMQVTLETSRGPAMWRVPHQLESKLAQGRLVRLTTTSMTGYIKKIDVLDQSPSDRNPV